MHRDPGTAGYAWLLQWQDGEKTVLDGDNHCYGLAFVLLAYSCGHSVGVPEARVWMDETWALLERHCWDASSGLYRDEASPDWVFSAYRGQNANMHMCEAMLTAYEVSREPRYLDRAHVLAGNMTQRQAAKAGGLIWEHYDARWEIDWDYHKDDPKHLFRPWGFQPGHQVEWAKLLMILERHRPEDWMLPTARRLFDTAMAKAWDPEYGGLCYGFAPDGRWCDTDKYFWVQAEALAAAALLAVRSGERGYWDWYQRLWAYAWEHLVDHRYGAWFRILDRKNRKYSDEKSPAGKTDYHTMGACHEVLRLLRGEVR